MQSSRINSCVFLPSKARSSVIPLSHNLCRGSAAEAAKLIVKRFSTTRRHPWSSSWFLQPRGSLLFKKTMGELMWLPAADGGEVLNFVEYRAKFSQALFGLRPEGFAVEATRDAAIVWGSAAELVSIFMDTVPICSISSATHSIWAFHVSVLDSLCVCLCCFAGSLVRDVPGGCGKCGSR